MDGMTAGLMFLVGLAGGWLLGVRKLAVAREDVARVTAKLEERERSADREQEVYKNALFDMEAKFSDLAKKALNENSDEFLKQTKTELKPVTDSLKELDKRSSAMEKARESAYASLSTQIRVMMESAEGMSKSSERMQTLLKGSGQVRGNWGEHLLRNVVEFAGMKEHVHFYTQKTEADGQRPDMVILLPGEDGIPVDSKCPFDSFQQASEENDPERSRNLMAKHAKAVRAHVEALRRKDYSGAVVGSIDFTVMFMPGDHLFESALQVDPELHDYALNKGILIANPVSLVALLRTVRIYWRQEKEFKNAEEMVSESRELYKRVLTFMSYYEKMGSKLNDAVKAHNDAWASFDSRLVPQGRKIESLKLDVGEDKKLCSEKTGPQEIELVARETTAGKTKEALFD